MDYIKDFKEEFKFVFNIGAVPDHSTRERLEKFITKVANDAEAKGRNYACDYIEKNKYIYSAYVQGRDAFREKQIIESARNTQV